MDVDVFELQMADVVVAALLDELVGAVWKDDGDAYTTGKAEVVAARGEADDTAAAAVTPTLFAPDLGRSLTPLSLTNTRLLPLSNPQPASLSIGYSRPANRLKLNPPLLSSRKLAISSVNSSSLTVQWKCCSAVASSWVDCMADGLV